MATPPVATPCVAPFVEAPLPSHHWPRMAGVVWMLTGGVYTLSCFGAVFGVPMLLIGLPLWQAGAASRAFHQTRRPEHAVDTAEALVRALRLYGVFAVVAVAAFTTVLIGLIVTLAMRLALGAP